MCCLPIATLSQVHRKPFSSFYRLLVLGCCTMSSKKHVLYSLQGLCSSAVQTSGLLLGLCSGHEVAQESVSLLQEALPSGAPDILPEERVRVLYGGERGGHEPGTGTSRAGQEQHMEQPGGTFARLTSLYKFFKMKLSLKAVQSEICFDKNPEIR